MRACSVSNGLICCFTLVLHHLKVMTNCILLENIVMTLLYCVQFFFPECISKLCWKTNFFFFFCLWHSPIKSLGTTFQWEVRPIPATANLSVLHCLLSYYPVSSFLKPWWWKKAWALSGWEANRKVFIYWLGWDRQGTFFELCTLFTFIVHWRSKCLQHGYSDYFLYV